MKSISLQSSHVCLTTMGTWRVNTFSNLNVITNVPLYFEKLSLAQRKLVIMLHWRKEKMIKMNLLFSRALNDHKAHPLPANMQSPDPRVATWEVLTLREWKWHKAYSHCRVNPSSLESHKRGECGGTCLVDNPHRSGFIRITILLVTRPVTGNILVLWINLCC